MSAEVLFRSASALVVPGWVLLIVLPRSKWTSRLICAALIPGALGLLYVYLILLYWGSAEGGFGSLSDVASLFEQPYVLLAGWIHYLAFDLFIGAWEVRDAQRHEIPHLLVIPCLALTFMFGPAGLLAYLGLRMGWKKQYFLSE